MKRLLIVLTLPILACGGLAESVSPTITPPTPLTVALMTQTAIQPIPDSAVAPPPTEVPSVNTNSLPNSNDYEWKLIASGLNRPVDIQPVNDGSNRLFFIEKSGYIRVYENGQLLETLKILQSYSNPL